MCSLLNCRSVFFLLDRLVKRSVTGQSASGHKTTRPRSAGACGRGGVDGTGDAGMINPASAGRSKRKPKEGDASDGVAPSPAPKPTSVGVGGHPVERAEGARNGTTRPEPRADRVHDPMERTARAPWVADTGRPRLPTIMPVRRLARPRRMPGPKGFALGG